MTGTRSTWWNRLAAPAIALSALSCAAAGPAPCPSTLTDPAGRHALVKVSLYDGPPNRMADQIPVPDGHGARWDIDRRMDPYLVCSFEGTKQTVTLHESGAKICKATDHPTRAWCQ